jgi:hypothetical protein
VEERGDTKANQQACVFESSAECLKEDRRVKFARSAQSILRDVIEAWTAGKGE